MVTFLAIVILVVVLIAVTSMVSAMLRGDWFAWLWFVLGGFESCGELIGICLTAIFDQ